VDWSLMLGLLFIGCAVGMLIMMLIFGH
jgi:hypothetical protein